MKLTVQEDISKLDIPEELKNRWKSGLRFFFIAGLIIGFAAGRFS